MNFQYNYNLHGGGRKPLIEAISQILDKPAIYQGAPSFSYVVGDYSVDRNGVLSYNSSIHPDFAAVLVRDLQEQGFVAEKVAVDNMAEESVADETTENVAENTATEIADAPDKLTIEIPDTGFTPEVRENLKKIVASKTTLLKQALGTDDLSIIEPSGKITFPWFTLHGLEGEADAYNHLVAALCKMAKNQKRVTATEKPVENAKFNMRLFLVRLGFVGDEYKTARKILLRNLNGNSSWKSGHKPEQPERNMASNESIEPVTAPEDEMSEEFSENKNEGGEAYGK